MSSGPVTLSKLVGKVAEMVTNARRSNITRTSWESSATDLTLGGKFDHLVTELFGDDDDTVWQDLDYRGNFERTSDKQASTVQHHEFCLK